MTPEEQETKDREFISGFDKLMKEDGSTIADLLDLIFETRQKEEDGNENN